MSILETLYGLTQTLTKSRRLSVWRYASFHLSQGAYHDMTAVFLVQF